VRRGAVPVVEDDGAHGLEAALVVRAHRHDHHEEGVLLRGRDADLRAGADEERAQVERAAGAVGRHELLVRRDDPVERLDEHLLGHGRHDAPHGRAVHAPRVLAGAEDDDPARLLAEGLDALEALLPVVEAARADVHRDVRILDEFERAPLAVLPHRADVAVDVREAETETRPVDICPWHC